MKVKMFVWTIAYFFIVNTVAISVALTSDNELKTTFSQPEVFGWFGGLLNYFGKLLTFQIEGFDPFMSFFLFYIPVLLILGIIIEWIRGV